MVDIVVDVEADGPAPGLYSMISFGAVVLSDTSDTFYGLCKPISNDWVPEALAICGFSREETLTLPEPSEIMVGFDKWLSKFDSRPRFYSDNNGFDWQFINFYFWRYLNRNPFGHSSTNIGSLYKGLNKDMRANFKRLRKTKHTHHPVSDAMGNAEALQVILEQFKAK